MRAQRLVVALTVTFVMSIGWVLTAADARNEQKADDSPVAQNNNKAERSRIAQGFEIAPVPLDLAGRDRDLVGLGSYLVNAVGGCNDCHTNPSYTHQGNPFAGLPKQVNSAHYLAGGTPFGPFVSRNITDVTEEHSFEEFLQMMREGKDFDLRHPQISPLLQVMPWPVYQDMTDHDLRAIYEYLDAIPNATRCASVGPLSPTQTDPTCVP